jgi:peroxiredoxin
MVMTSSTMLPLGSKIPSFRLPDAAGKMASLDDFKNPSAYLVIFMCNHCPFVKHVKGELASLAREYVAKNVAIVGINANDAENFPEDSPAKMAEVAKSAGYVFPYLYDGTQETAKAYRAACTPEFYLADKSQKLVYRGQMDSSRPGNLIPVTGGDLRRALDDVLSGRLPPEEQMPGIGCNIKWKPGNEPDYFKR